MAAVLLRLQEGRGFDTLGDTKVGDLDVSFIINKDIGALDISVNNVPSMQI